MTAFKLVALTVCLAVVESGHLGGNGGISSSYGVPSLDSYSSQDSYNVGGGYGSGHGGHDQAQPYEFGYAVKDAHTGNDFKQQEHSDGNTVKGQYRVLLPDGRTQIVTYTADWKTGFHADVKYEGEAHYPTNYNTYGGQLSYSAPSSSYGPPGYTK